MTASRVVPVVLCGCLLAAVPRVTHADEETGLAWGIYATEVSTAGIFALNFGVDDWPSDGPGLALNFLPMVIGPGVGYLAHRGDWGARPAYALQGASMVGLDLFMIGAMIDGRDERDGLRIGPAAWTLGTLGAGLGTWLGATEVDSQSEGTALFAGPAGGLVVGGFLIGGAAALAAGDSDKAPQRFVLGGTIGLSLGLAGSLYYATRSSHDDPADTTTRLPAVDASPGRVLFSFAGAF